MKKCGIGRKLLSALAHNSSNILLLPFSLFPFTFPFGYAAEREGAQHAYDWRIVAADQHSKSVVIVSGEPGATPSFLWQWDPAKDPGIAADDVPSFAEMDECKLCEDGKTLIVCSSSQGVAGIDVVTGRAKWYAGARLGVQNAHSVELLPDGRVAVACSTGGDALMLYDVSSAPFDPAAQRSVRAAKVPGAHGIAWDVVRGTLFVLGYDHLYEFAYRPESMSVKELHRWNYVGACEDERGHDLVPDGRGGYYLTNYTGVWRFDPGDGTFVSVRVRANVKSFSRDVEKGDLMQVPTEKWWSDRLVVINPDGTERTVGPFPNARFYKARWMGK